MENRLSDIQVYDLVRTYRKYKCLWDVADENYKNREARDNAYKEILEKLNIPGMKLRDVPAKIKNLRTSYYMELRKIEASIKEGRKRYRPKVAWFRMADKMMKNVSRTLLSAEAEADSDTDFSITELINTKKKEELQILSQTTPQTIQYVHDEYESYGKYIALSLRAMPPEMSIIAKLELQKTIGDVQLQAFKYMQGAANSVTCGPSTPKMEEDPLEDPLEKSGMDTETDIVPNVKTEEEG